jgi:hypothetical protein
VGHTGFGKHAEEDKARVLVMGVAIELQAWGSTFQQLLRGMVGGDVSHLGHTATWGFECWLCDVREQHLLYGSRGQRRVSVYSSMFRVQLGGKHGVGLRSKLRWEI